MIVIIREKFIKVSTDSVLRVCFSFLILGFLKKNKKILTDEYALLKKNFTFGPAKIDPKNVKLDKAQKLLWKCQKQTLAFLEKILSCIRCSYDKFNTVQ